MSRVAATGRAQRPRPDPPPAEFPPEPRLAPTGAPRRWPWEPPAWPPPAPLAPLRRVRRDEEEAPPALPGLPCPEPLPGLPLFSQGAAPRCFFFGCTPGFTGAGPEPFPLPTGAGPSGAPLPLALGAAGLDVRSLLHVLVARAGRTERWPPGRRPEPLLAGRLSGREAGRRGGGSPITAAMADTSAAVVPMGTPICRCSFFTAAALSGVTKLTTTPVAPARAVRPERCT